MVFSVIGLVAKQPPMLPLITATVDLTGDLIICELYVMGRYDVIVGVHLLT